MRTRGLQPPDLDVILYDRRATLAVVNSIVKPDTQEPPEPGQLRRPRGLTIHTPSEHCARPDSRRPASLSHTATHLPWMLSYSTKSPCLIMFWNCCLVTKW